MKLLKIICAAKMLGKACKTIQAQNHNLQPHTGVTSVRLPLRSAWLAIKEWLRETAGVEWLEVCKASGHALKQESEFKYLTLASFSKCCAAWLSDTAWVL